MKVRKESLILVVVIIALSVYLMMRKMDRTHYDLPKVTPIKISQISSLEIAKPDGATIVLAKKADEDRWEIAPEGYEAQEDKVEGLLNAVGDLTVTALVSESESYSRYELDPAHRIVVKVWQGEKLVREFDVGKAAPSFRHTFVKLAGDRRVYHADGNFRSRFDVTVDSLRDKTVLAFDQETITEMGIVRGEETLKFVRMEVPSEGTEEQKEGETSSSEKTKTVWKTPEGREGDEAQLKRLLNALSDLRCDQFLENMKKEDLKDPTHVFELKGTEGYSLSLFAQRGEDDKKFPAVSSGSAYPFFLPEWQVNNLTKKLDELVKEGAKDDEKK